MPQFNMTPKPPPATGLSWVDALANAAKPPSQLDWASALSPGFGVVTTPAAAGAQALKAGAPKVYNALEGLPFRQTLNYALGTRRMPGAAGVTTLNPSATASQILTKPKLAADLETLLHEALHGLYYAKTKGTTQSPLPPEKYASSIVNKLLAKLKMDPYQEMLYNQIYGGDPAHGAVELMAQNMMKRLPSKPQTNFDWLMRHFRAQ